MSRKPVNKMSLDQRVLGFIQEHRLMANGQILLVAVSGGQDSVCLLHLLNQLQPILGIKLHVAHLNHQLRGKESDGDARYVARLATKLGIPATIEKRDVIAYQKERGLSLEEAAREVRYGFLAEVASTIGADSAAVGHTLDDQVETILLHLIRGTGTRGLRGLQPLTRWRLAEKELTVVRPLLDIRRGETGAYCQSFELHPRQDATNLSMEPLRNRVRLELLPLLKSYNPQVNDTLLRTAHIAGEDTAYLEKEADRIWAQVAAKQDGMIILGKKAVLKLAPVMQRYLMRLAIENLVGNLKDIEARHIEEMVQALNKPAGKQISLPYGLVFSIDYGRYLLGKDRTALSPFPALDGEYAIKIPGITVIPGWRIQVNIIDSLDSIRDNNSFTGHFDYSRTSDKLVVRSRKRGDRFQPLGMKDKKNLAQFMLDAKIPAHWRDNIPIIASPDGIVWVMGYRIDERVKVTEKTKKVLRLEFQRI
jgi:tRNA(Ile)-lysidine synthase